MMQVLDAIGKGPIYAANVSIYNAGGQLIKEGLTGKDGSFMASLTDGIYVVEVATKGYTAYKDKVVVASSADTFLEVLMVQEGR
ncbi:MAG TPA: carboxypeptidase-like regulatory domain-containing protein [Chloroflexia bacterium]|nr:carboxypeptidase-like regulatory domain-containing protein [Chloroflexia bacterium]